jgi:hypothetical protein
MLASQCRNIGFSRGLLCVKFVLGEMILVQVSAVLL